MHQVRVGIINFAKNSVAITSCVQDIIERGKCFTMTLWCVKPKEKWNHGAHPKYKLLSD